MASQRQQGGWRPQGLRKTWRWDQFTALLMVHLSGRQSLRDIEANLRSQRHLLALIGARPIARSSLARLNREQPCTLFEALFQHLLSPCRRQCIALNGTNQKKTAPQLLRYVGYHDAQSDQDDEFLTHRFDLAAKTIAAIYKARWQVELFFKDLKQNLKIHAFVENSPNAVRTQVWIALITWLLSWRLKVQSGTAWSLQRLMRVLQMNVFAKRDVLALVRGTPPPEPRLAARLGSGT